MTEYGSYYPHRRGFFVYRAWNAANMCIYVGRVGNRGPRSIWSRVGEHAVADPWWCDEVDHIDVAEFASFAEVEQEEVAQIRLLTPVYNRTHSPECRKGHDLSVAGGRTPGGICRACMREWSAKRQATPEYQAFKRRYEADPAVRAARRQRDRERYANDAVYRGAKVARERERRATRRMERVGSA